MIAQHPLCHVWPAFQAVERSSMQSWSPPDVGQPAPGLGEGAGEGQGRVNGGRQEKRMYVERRGDKESHCNMC